MIRRALSKSPWMSPRAPKTLQLPKLPNFKNRQIELPKLIRNSADGPQSAYHVAKLQAAKNIRGDFGNEILAVMAILAILAMHYGAGGAEGAAGTSRSCLSQMKSLLL